MIKIFLAATAAAVLIGTQASAATYTFDRAIGTLQVSGFFETDGTLGVLDATNIVRYEFTIGNGVYRGARAILNRSNLSATPTDLIYNFTPNIGYAFFIGNDTVTGASGYICYQNGGCFDSRVQGIGVGFEPSSRTDALTGSQVIASATAAALPEPASWALMIGGFGMAGGALRRRKGATKITFA